MDIILRSRRVQGPEHPQTLLFIANLGSLYLNDLQFTKAKPWLRQALEGQERVLGLSHSKTLITLGNLAQTLSALGEHDGALSMIEDGISRSLTAYGERNPSTIYLRKELGAILVARGT